MSTAAVLHGHARGDLDLVDMVEFRRLEVTRRLDADRRSELGQFLTPPNVAQFMASMFQPFGDRVRVLDAGAGVGSLLAAFCAEAYGRPRRPRAIEAVAYEVDPTMRPYLAQTLEACAAAGRVPGVEVSTELVASDFIAAAVEDLEPGLFRQGSRRRGFTHAILNPPYKKLNSDSAARLALRRVGVETSNVYTAFLALAVLMLEPGGELVAITPRSFCNGPYFRPFRELFLSTMNLSRIHVFESRTAAFADDEVLQENLIIHAVKGEPQGAVVVSSSSGPDDDMIATRTVDFDQIVRPGDAERFIHVVPDELGQHVADRFHSLTSGLADLRVSVSTGRVVDFRAREFLRRDPGPKTEPLIYPTHFENGVVRWPKQSKKPNALAIAAETEPLWMPSGIYVLVKRFSSKEERRRVVAAIFDPKLVPSERIGFENHLNVFHDDGRGLTRDLARGLAAFLNSTLVDAYFRQFNGHTQVNATDLRSFKYPPRERLEALGRAVGSKQRTQDELDALVEELVAVGNSNADPIQAKKRIDEALAVLKALGLPREQQNERSALSLLSLLDVKPSTSWKQASAPLMGITPMMSFFSDHYGKTYAPNSRETVRRFTVHQFLDAGIVVANPDKPARPVNSPKAVYQIEASALELLQTFGTKGWDAALAAYLASVGTLQSRYEQAREMAKLPVRLPEGQQMTLSPGGQNDLVKLILEEFCPRFTPGAHVIYVGDTEEKWALFDEKALRKLGVVVDSHGKMPDVVVHHVAKNWLLLIEAVTSHGPVNPKRQKELATLFKGSSAGLVYVTTFLSRKAMVKYLGDISWETEVWVAEAPDHMIHFNGERFLGPYEPPKSR
jgi:adenine-specific DNA-methyltransferase